MRRSGVSSQGASARTHNFITMHKNIFATRDKEHRQTALIDAANAVFAERGFDAATTREIAERAGCAEGLIHRYFSGKRGLLLAILDDKAGQIADEFGATLRETDSVREEIEQIIVRDIEAKWEKRDFMRVSVSQAAIDPELGAAIRERVALRQVALIADRLRDHQVAGRIRLDVDIDAIASAIGGIGFATGFMYQIAFGAPREETLNIAKVAAAAIARGISPQQEE
jgi:AcrR family transcriptional regulator